VKPLGRLDETTVELRGAAPSAFFARSGVNDVGEARWEGLGFGRYSVSAGQRDLVSDIKTVMLAPTHPQASVDLELQENRTILILRDESGNRIRGVRFPSTSSAIPEIAPGEYSLQAVVPGTPLLILPAQGFVPLCRTVALNQTLEILASRGRTVTVQLPTRNMPTLDFRAGSLLGIPGADCPVGLSSFEFEKLPTSEDQPSRFVIFNFPTSDSLILRSRGRNQPRNQPVLIADDGVVTLRP
jgi:hypothetical protein